MSAVPIHRRRTLTVAAALLLLAYLLIAPARSAHAADTNLSQGKPATASSIENAGTPASAAVDGNTGTRWSSAFSDPQWLQVDLGASANISSVVLNWETAHATAFQIQTSADGTTWTSIYGTTTGPGGVQTLSVTGTGRYVRMYGTARANGYGYSLWEFQVIGSLVGGGGGGCGTANAAVGKTATASSIENAGTPASSAVDNNTGTRWSSAASDPQWLQIDLGTSQSICSVVLNWEAAYGKSFQIQTSPDAATWTSIYTTTTGAGGVQTLSVTGTGRYVRMYGTIRGTVYGYSLWEFGIYLGTGGGTDTTAPTTPANLAAGATTSSTVPLTWSASTDNVGVTGYRVYRGATLVTTVTGLSYTDVGLTASTAYTYTVRAIDAAGNASAASNAVTATTQSGTTLPGGGPLGSNVIVFDSSMSMTSIQSQLDSVFATQESNQFGTQRYALLFKPGNYTNLNAQIGFYTSIMGLGKNPDDTTIHGDVTVDAGWFGGNATQNFWRSTSNLNLFPVSGADRWAVAQAAPFRRMDIHGDLNLAPNGYGWASGGYIADSRISGVLQPYSQQQWYTRDSSIASSLNGVWNQVFSGVSGAPANGLPYTTLATTPVSREEPYLYLDTAGNYNVFVPSMRTNSSGTTWAGGSTPGTSIPYSQFYVAKPSDSTATINAALAQGLNLLFTPGVYNVTQTINVTRANTVVMGIGFPTLIPQNGVNAMSVSDVDGVKLSGLLFDAGPVNTPVLLQIGATGANADHSANPISVQDVFFRIGGAGPGKATTSLIVNSNNTLIDHIWAWRADHGAGVGWTTNTADTGLIVNGNNVIGVGLFVEHFQKNEVIWNGNGGKEIFFQNEMPYDPPSAAGWMNGSQVGYAAFKVGAGVTSFEAWGMGSYCNFTSDPTIAAYHAFEAPNNPNVKFHNLLTVSLGGKGSIVHIINDTGGTAQGTATVPVNLVAYP